MARSYVIRSNLDCTSPPAGAVNVVSDFGAHRDGVTNDADHIQSAIDSLGTSGGDIYFPPGPYLTGTTLRLPAGNSAVMGLWGYGAVVTLSGNWSFLRFDDTSNTVPYLSFRNFLIKGFEVNAAARSASYGPAFLGAGGALGSICTYRADIENLTIKDVYIHSAPPVSGGACYGISLSCKHLDEAESTVNHIRNILIKDVRITGGDSGVLILGQVSAANYPEVLPANMSIEIDSIRVENLYFDAGKTPPFSSQLMHCGLQIGSEGKVGHIDVRNSYLASSADNLMEINNCVRADVTNVHTKEAYNAGFTVARYGLPLDAVPGVNEGSMDIRFNGCSYDHGTRGAEASTGWSQDHSEVATAHHATYSTTWTDCYEIDSDGDTVANALREW